MGRRYRIGSSFYMKYFGALCNDRYVNESKKFTSYFYLLMREQLVLN